MAESGVEGHYIYNGDYLTICQALNRITDLDQRFVMIQNLGGDDATELIVVENFFEELRAKVGN